MRWTSLLSVALVAALGLATEAQADRLTDATLEQAYLSERVTSELDDLRREARASFGPLMDYPADVRHAIWELCTDPELMILMDRSRAGRPDIERLIEDRPASVQRAARSLAQHPGIVSLLADNVGTASILGRVYAEDPAEIRRVLDRLAESANASSSVVNDDWESRMRQNPSARKELETAYDAWALEQRRSGIDVTVNVVVPHGGFVHRKGVVVIYRPPSHTFALWLLDRPVLYSWLWAELWHHHHHHHRWYQHRWRHHRWHWDDVSRRVERRVDRRYDRRDDRRDDRKDDRRDDRKDDRRADRKDDRVDDRRIDRRDDRGGDAVRRGTLSEKEKTRDAQNRHREAWSGRTPSKEKASKAPARSSSSGRSRTRR